MSRRQKRNYTVLNVFIIISAMVFVIVDEVHLHVIAGFLVVMLLAVHTTIKRSILSSRKT